MQNETAVYDVVGHAVSERRQHVAMRKPHRTWQGFQILGGKRQRSIGKIDPLVARRRDATQNRREDMRIAATEIEQRKVAALETRAQGAFDLLAERSVEHEILDDDFLIGVPEIENLA